MNRMKNWLYHNLDVIAALVVALICLAMCLYMSSTASASTLEDSFLGTKVATTPAGRQILPGDTVYLHFVVSNITDRKPITVQWYCKGRLKKTSSIKATKPMHYSSISVKGFETEWTAVIMDSYGHRRTHNFSVRRK